VSVGAPGREASPLARVPIYAEGWAGSSVNVVADLHNTLVTDGHTQYAAFYAADGSLILARRQLRHDKWETVKTALQGRVADAHNTVSIAVDGAGYLHVAWDHHASPLRYCRSTAPGSLTLGPTMAMTGSQEESVTYPSFFRLPAGDLLFLYRDGRSGQGNLVLKRYVTKTRTWHLVQSNLVSGEGVRSAYVAGTVDAKGVLHLAWNWRDSPDVATNHDLCYARSSDGGRTWTTTAGAALALPITAAAAEYALRIPQHSSLMNPPALATDEDGHPYIATYWSPAGSDVPQFQLVRYDGRQWTVSAITQRVTPFVLQGTATKRPPLSRAVLLTGKAGKKATAVHLVYRDDEHGGRVRAASCADVAHPQWHVRDLTEESVGAWEPSIDVIQWRRFGQAHLLVQSVEQQDGNDSTPAVVRPTPVSLLTWTP
jgi:BNR repeat-containing family member